MTESDVRTTSVRLCYSKEGLFLIVSEEWLLSSGGVIVSSDSSSMVSALSNECSMFGMYFI